MIKEKRPALGRGLDALLGSPPAAAPATGTETMFACPIERIAPMAAGQPRKVFDDTKLEELAQSIREQGILQPLVVRRAAAQPGATGDAYEIVIGERRWRAAQRAGLHEVPVVVKDVGASEAFLYALVENVQRDDLNPVELAEAIDQAMRQSGLSHEQVAQQLGKDRSTIANVVRLLKLPARVRQMLLDGQLTEGHARALLGAPDSSAIERLADKVVRGRLSVRETERLVRAAARAKKGDGARPGEKSAGVRDLEERLTKRFGTRVEVRDKSGKGELAIRYSSLDELDRILEALLKV